MKQYNTHTYRIASLPCQILSTRLPKCDTKTALISSSTEQTYEEGDGAY